MSYSINCIVVDDEPLALKLIESYVAKTPFLNLVAKCNNAFEALEIVEENSIDLLFLDIEMPNLTGMELSKMIKEKNIKIVFTTAYEKYAIEGYKVNAIGYLLKPFDYSEFLDSALKAKQLIDSQHQELNIDEKYMLIKADYKVQQIEIEDIIFVEGIKDYIKIHRESNNKAIMALMSMKAVEDKLSKTNFMRVHRSYIVNLNKIKVIEKSRIVFGKTYIPVSTKYKENFQEFLDQRFLKR